MCLPICEYELFPLTEPLRHARPGTQPPQAPWWDCIKCMVNVICSRVWFICKFRESKLLVVAVEIQHLNKVYDICPNLSVSRNSSCFLPKLYTKPKNGTQTFVICKVLNESFAFLLDPFYQKLKPVKVMSVPRAMKRLYF